MAFVTLGSAAPKPLVPISERVKKYARAIDQAEVKINAAIARQRLSLLFGGFLKCFEDGLAFGLGDRDEKNIGESIGYNTLESYCTPGYDSKISAYLGQAKARPHRVECRSSHANSISSVSGAGCAARLSYPQASFSPK